MKIRRFKNLFCLCAVAGCHHLANTAMEVKYQNKNKKIIIYTCIDCSFDLCDFNKF